MPAKIDLIGQRFGRLVVVSEAGSRNGKVRWNCICDCGNEVVVDTSSLRSGNSKSCGCYQRYMASITGVKHRETQKTRLYNIWLNMKERCLCDTNKGFAGYGARGITVCDEWKDSYVAFRDWALANGYDGSKTLDRVNNNESYSPENCRWATCTEQANNKRNNVLIEFEGETHTISEWAKMFGINYYTLHSRLTKLGWSVDRALLTSSKRGI